jgi:hypothetical protein
MTSIILHALPLALAAMLALVIATPASATDCKTYTTVTPDNAAVAHSKQVLTGAAAHNGTAYTKAAFCPVGAAAGTCTGESLSEPVGSHIEGWTTYDGNVPDINQHRNGLQIGNLFIPLTPLLPGACA